MLLMDIQLQRCDQGHLQFTPRQYVIQTNYLLSCFQFKADGKVMVDYRSLTSSPLTLLEGTSSDESSLTPDYLRVDTWPAPPGVTFRHK